MRKLFSTLIILLMCFSLQGNVIEMQKAVLLKIIKASFYSHSADGRCRGMDSNNWDTTHDQTSSTDVTNTQDTNRAAAEYWAGGGVYAISRQFYAFDTSTIPDNASIVKAVLYVYGNGKYSASCKITIVEGLQASGTALVTADYDNCGDAVDNPTEGIDTADRIDSTAWSSAAYNTFELNATGRGWVNKTGYTKLGMREYTHDCLDVSPGTSIDYGVFCYDKEVTGTSKDPYLYIEYYY